jgi:cell division inhibitor SulA
MNTTTISPTGWCPTCERIHGDDYVCPNDRSAVYASLIRITAELSEPLRLVAPNQHLSRAMLLSTAMERLVQLQQLDNLDQLRKNMNLRITDVEFDS